MIQLRSCADDELIKLYEAGEDEAFDVLMTRYKDRLYTYILFIVKNSDIADDLFQETFVRVIMTIRQHRYKATGKFYAWLTRIAHNLIIDQFRTERSEGLVYDEEQSNNIFNNAHLSDTSTSLCAWVFAKKPKAAKIEKSNFFIRTIVMFAVLKS